MRGIKPQAENWLESYMHIYSPVQYKSITRKIIPQVCTMLSIQCMYTQKHKWYYIGYALNVQKISTTTSTFEHMRTHTHAQIHTQLPPIHSPHAMTSHTTQKVDLHTFCSRAVTHTSCIHMWSDFFAEQINPSPLTFQHVTESFRVGGHCMTG